MKNVSALENIHKHGLFGNHDSKDELINIREIKDVLIYQIVKYKKSSISIDKIKIDNLNLPETLLVSSNKNTRILWMGPDNWLVVSKNKEIEKSIIENDFLFIFPKQFLSFQFAADQYTYIPRHQKMHLLPT